MDVLITFFLSPVEGDVSWLDFTSFLEVAIAFNLALGLIKSLTENIKNTTNYKVDRISESIDKKCTELEVSAVADGGLPRKFSEYALAASREKYDAQVSAIIVNTKNKSFISFFIAFALLFGCSAFPYTMFHNIFIARIVFGLLVVYLALYPVLRLLIRQKSLAKKYEEACKGTEEHLNSTIKALNHTGVKVPKIRREQTQHSQSSK